MAAAELHPFFAIDDDASRQQWLAAFCVRPGSYDPPFDVSFPTLRSGESPASWLADQFRRAKRKKGYQARLERPVVETVVTQAIREPAAHRYQVIGLLLQVAGDCGMTAVAEALRGWVQADHHPEATYRLLGETIHLRRTVWSLLIGWHKTEDLLSRLRRDFRRPTLGCAALCFREIGRLAPAEALGRIPQLFDMPEPYWREIARRFLSELGPGETFEPAYRRGWRRCLEAMDWSTRDGVAHLAVARNRRAFQQVLDDLQIRYRRTGQTSLLSWGGRELRFRDRRTVVGRLDRHIADETNDGFRPGTGQARS